MSAKVDKRARQQRRNRPQEQIRAEQMKRSARAVLRIDIAPFDGTRTVQVVLGWMRAAFTQIETIVLCAENGLAHAASPNRRSLMEIALRLQHFASITSEDRASAVSALIEEEKRQAENHKKHLSEMGVAEAGLPHFEDLEAVVTGDVPAKVRQELNSIVNVAKSIQNAGVYRAWRAETQLAHATVFLGLSYAPAQTEALVSRTPIVIDEDHEILTLVSLSIVAYAVRVLSEEGIAKELYDQIWDAYFSGIQAGL